MAPAVAQALRDTGRRFRRLVLVSPWLDVAVDRPSSGRSSAYPMLAIPGLVEAARIYANGLPLADPR